MKSIMIIVCVLLANILLAQVEEIKLKLNKIQEVKTDTAKINAFNDVAYRFIRLNIDSTLKYAKIAKEFAEKVGYEKGIGAAKRNIGTYYGSLKHYNEEKAKTYFDEALKIARNLGDDREILKAYMAYSFLYYNGRDVNKSYSFSEMAIKYARKLNDKYLLGESLLLHGENLYYLNNNLESAEITLEAIKIMEQINNKFGLIVANIDISLTYFATERFDKVIEHSNNALKLITKDVQFNSFPIYYNMGLAYEGLKQPRKAIEHYLKASKQSIESGQEVTVSVAEIAAARIYTTLKEYNKAETHTNIAIKYLNNTKDMTIQRDTYSMAGDVNINLGKFVEAIQYLNKGLSLSKGDAGKGARVEIFRLLSLAYEKKNELKKSLDYHKLYFATTDSLYDKSSLDKLTEMQTKYETKIKEEENSLLKKEQEFQRNKLNEQYYLILAFSAAFLFAVALTFVLIYHIRKRKKMYHLLEEQKQQTDLYAEALRQSNITKDKFFSIIAHDLKNPFHSLLMLLSTIIDDNSNLDSAKIKSLCAKMYNNTKNAYSLLENLLNWSRTQTGRLKFQPENFILSEVIDSNLELLTQQAEEKNITLKYETKDNYKVYSDKNMIDLVIRNLISNAIKFTKNNGEVKLSINSNEEHVVLNISDNGVGIPEDVKENLFKVTLNSSTKGTNDEKGTGLGLVLCKEFVEKQNGVIWFESKENIGTQFYFTIPKAAV